MESSPGRAPRLDRTPAANVPEVPSSPAPSPPTAAPGLPLRIWLLLGVLATTQFLNTVDFMIMMPLSPQFMRLFGITISEFSAAVSAYAVAAGVAGLGAALVLDRYGRRASLLVIFGGLVVGTFFCALAPSYGALLAARIFCGLFGGILGASVLAAVGDLVPDSHRGRAVGLVMSSFSLATVLGLPLGLWLADRWGWHAPFLTLAGAGAVLWVLAARLLPPMRAHLTAGNARIRPFDRLVGALRPAAHRRAYALMGALTLAGMCVVPYIAAYLVGNVGLEERRLTLVYAVGGAGTLVSMNVVGRLADSFDRFRVFAGVCGGSMLVTLALTHAPSLGLGAALALSAAMMVFMSGRFIPAMAMATTAGDPAQRGAYMGVMASVQQFASGLAALASGWVVASDAAGRLTGYGIIGWISAGLAAASIPLAWRLRGR